VRCAHDAPPLRRRALMRINRLVDRLAPLLVA